MIVWYKYCLSITVEAVEKSLEFVIPYAYNGDNGSTSEQGGAATAEHVPG
jgi:hypothetical protein